MSVFRKELTDNLSSKRFLILLALIYLAGIATIYVVAQSIRSSVDANTQFIFIRLFTTSGEDLPFSFPFFMSLFIPIVGIALGFDAINSERSSRNLSRLLAQPIYRDAVINGKFLAGLTTITILVVSLVAIVSGMGLRMIGIPPGAEEILRIFGFIFISILYGAFWLALSILFSIVFKRTATSALFTIALWILLFFFMPFIANGIGNAMIPVNENSTLELAAKNDELTRNISRISPSTLYGETVQVLLYPEMGNPSALLMMISIYSSGLIPRPLSLLQSLLITWPQLVSLIALTAICFSVSYILFTREEIRST